VARSKLREVLPDVIDDAVCSQSSRLLHVPGAADARYLCPERIRDLHGEGADASRGVVDQDLLPRLDVPVIA
jgi:hypothetical protein